MNLLATDLLDNYSCIFVILTSQYILGILSCQILFYKSLFSGGSAGLFLVLQRFSPCSLRP